MLQPIQRTPLKLVKSSYPHSAYYRTHAPLHACNRADKVLILAKYWHSNDGAGFTSLVRYVLNTVYYVSDVRVKYVTSISDEYMMVHAI